MPVIRQHAVLCMTIAIAQAIDSDHLMQLPISRKLATGPVDRITGGIEASPYSLPYQVGMYFTMNGGIGFCGGSLISKRWVLTSAYCAERGSNFLVVLGAHEIRDEQEATQVRVETQHTVIHPDWDSDTLVNDIALVRLPSPVTFTEAIQPIRLPSKSHHNETFEGWQAIESGWGKPSDTATGISERLQYVNTTIIDHETCNTWYTDDINSKAQICTDGSNGQSTCSYDTGGPLVITEGDNVPTLVGVDSFNTDLGCQVGWPAVAVRLTNYVEWISSITGIELRD